MREGGRAAKGRRKLACWGRKGEKEGGQRSGATVSLRWQGRRSTPPLRSSLQFAFRRQDSDLTSVAPAPSEAARS